MEKDDLGDLPGKDLLGKDDVTPKADVGYQMYINRLRAWVCYDIYVRMRKKRERGLSGCVSMTSSPYGS